MTKCERVGRFVHAVSIRCKRPLDYDCRSVHIGMSLIPSNCNQEYRNVDNIVIRNVYEAEINSFSYCIVSL